MLCDTLFSSVILSDQFYLLLQVAFPIQKWPYFSNFVYIFPNIMKKVFIFSQI